MIWNLERNFKLKLSAGFIIIILSLGAVFYKSRQSNNDFINTAEWVDHTEKVLYHAERIISTVNDIQTGARGYILTDNKNFLLPFNAGQADLPLFIKTLKNLTRDNPVQQKHIDSLSLLTNNALSLSRGLIELGRTKILLSDSQSMMILEEGTNMDAIKSLMAVIQAEENRLFFIRKNANRESIATNKKLNYILGGLIIIILFTGMLLLFQYNAEIKKANKIIRARNGELKDLTAHLKNIREDERKKISREVHDEIGQLASVTKMDADWLYIHLPGLEEKAKKRIERIISVTLIMIDKIREVAISLRPSSIEELGLNASLKYECTEFQRLNPIKCFFEDNYDDEKMPLEIRTELYRICQECLAHILEQAHATEIMVSITGTGNSVTLSIAHNGSGFITNKKIANTRWVGIRERISSINGKLTVTGGAGTTTAISIVVPEGWV